MAHSSLHILTTGGTIGSLLNAEAGTRDMPHDSPLAPVLTGLLGDDAVVRSVLNIDSGDMEPRHWAQLIAAVGDAVAQGATRILITHGTDTLHYSAALLGQIAWPPDVKIVLTGSMRALDQPDSDAPRNLGAASAALASAELPGGVYVAFAGPDAESAHIIHALDVMPVAMDEAHFRGTHNRRAAVVRDGRLMRSSLPPGIADADNLPPLQLDWRVLSAAVLERAALQVAQTALHPGQDFSIYALLALRGDTVLVVGNYHSGTAPALAADNPHSLICYVRAQNERRQAGRAFTRIVMATQPETLPAPYANTAALQREGAQILTRWLPHQLFVRQVLGLAAGLSPEEVMAPLARWQLRPQP